jgi:GNAT superfamily N-acetyltransferase
VTWPIVPLSSSHVRSNFDCGYSQLDNYLRNFAGQHSRKDIGRTFVALSPGTNLVAGYYTLSASSVEFQRVPEPAQRRLGNYPIPTALLGKLAVNQSHQGNGLGTMLLIDAMRRVTAISSEIAIYALEVHALDERAASFYQKFGFQSFRDNEAHLFLPLATIKALF